MLLASLHFALLGLQNPQSSLPDEWFGTWKGKVKLQGSDTKEREVGMELSVGKVPGSQDASWTITYTDGAKKDVRAYVLSPVKDKPNRFVTDEKNGIVLDDTLIGNTLYSQFKVQETLLHVRFRLSGKSMEVEMCSYSFKEARSTSATASGEKVDSYHLRSVQSGVLKKAR